LEKMRALVTGREPEQAITLLGGEVIAGETA
jgi:hypothetical protein